MSLIGFEGFEDSQTATNNWPDEGIGFGQATGGSAVVGAFWQNPGAFGTTKSAGLLGGSCISFQVNGSTRCILNATYTRLIWGARILTPGNLLTNGTCVVVFYDGSTAQCGVNINTSGHLFLWRGALANVIATGATTFSPNSWYYLEIDITFNNSTGAYNIRINGTGTEISGSGVNTIASANNQATAFWLTDFSTANTLSCSYDDLYLLDPTTGGAPFNAMLGLCRVETLFPTANDAVTWTPNASTNVSRVQEANADSDTTYNATATTGQDTFAHGSLSSTPTTIFAVAVRCVMRKDQSSNPTAQTILVSGATTQAGAVNTQATTYLTMRDIYLNDPNTSAAWTAAAVNATKIGYNRTL